MTDRIPSSSNTPGRALDQIASEKRRADHLRLATELGLFALLALLIPVLLDYIYFWPLAVRCAAGVAWLILLATIGTIEFRKRRGLKSAKIAALELERRHPALRCDISTAAECAERPDHRPLQSELISGLRQHADFQLQAIGHPWRRQAIGWIAFATLGAMALLLVLFLVPISRLAFERILVPWAVPFYTRIEVRPHQAEIPVTSDLAVTAKFLGRLPSQSRIEWKTGNGPWQSAMMNPTARDRARYDFKNLHESFLFRVAANDAVSPEYPVTVYATPDVAMWQLDAVPPAYANLPTQHSTDGEMTALRGSELHWHLVSTRPLSKADVHFEKDLPNIALKSESDMAWTGDMTLKTSADYHAQLLDEAGHANLRPALHHLIAVPDAPPRVVITSPDQVISADPGDKIPIAIEATDDIGLSSVNLIYRRPGTPPTVVSLYPAGQQGRQFAATPVLDLAPLQLKPFDVVIYYAEARDNNTYDGPGVGRSRAQFIVIRGPPGSTPPPPPSSGPSSGSSQEINLTQMQRDLIAATTMLADNAPRNAMKDLATAQGQIRDLASKGSAALQSTHADPGGIAALAAAIEAMGHAESSLNSGNRPASLDEEALALASLYQASHALPSTNSPSGGSGELRIKLDDGGQRAAQQQQTQKQLSQALAQASSLTAAQQALEAKSEGQGQGQGQGETPDEGQGNGPSKIKPNDPGKGASNDPSPDGKGADGTSSNTQGPGYDPAKLGAEQAALAAQARQLADFLNKAAGSDPGVSHGMAGSAGKAAGEMEIAAGEFKRGATYDRPKVSTAQRSSIEALDQVQDYLKNTIAAEDHGTTTQDETIPPEYADQLAHYFQKLSHEK
jgi:hypothetical protein